MTSQSMRRALFVCAILSLPAGGGVLRADEGGFLVNFGSVLFEPNSAGPLKNFPTFEAILPISVTIDPFEKDALSVLCEISAQKNDSSVRKAKGRFTTDLYVLDHTTGMFEIFAVDKGKFKTDQDGIDFFDFEIPTSIFADGFESGDVSAWSYTRADFIKKTGDKAHMICSLAEGR